MPLTVRVLVPADADAYRELRLRSLREEPTSFAASWEEERELPHQAFLDRLAPQDDRRSFGAFDGDSLVGMVVLLREPKRKLRHKGLIVSVYVAPEARRLGVARRLLEAALAHAAGSMGLQQVNLAVNAANHAALALYEAAGFVAFGTEPACLVVDGVPQDETHMALRFPRDGRS